MIYVFGDCELDLQRLELRRAGKPCHIEPQVFDVLRHLVEQRDRLVSRDELLDGIWGHRFVTPATLNSRIKAARQAIGDDGDAQKLIRTVRGRGFRFLGEVRVQEDGAGPARGAIVARISAAVPLEFEPATPGPPELVGRGVEQERLAALLASASAGNRRLVFVGGEPGIGKSTLTEAFLAGVRAAGGVRIARGQCLDRRGPGEPYLPLLDALGRLGREADGAEVVALLEACAPTWLAQLPSLLGPEHIERVRRAAIGATRERMLREMVEALELLSRDRPLLLLLEDVHWSDPSTLDLLAWLGQRTEPARLLLLATYRTDEAAPDLEAVIATLRRGGQLAEIQLRRWSEAELREHLARRFAGREIPAGVIALLHTRAEGNPLFVQNLLDAWLESGALERALNGAAEIHELAAEVPETLRVLIEQRVERLSTDDRSLLDMASVAGMEFCAALIAAAGDLDAERTDERIAALARAGHVVEGAGTEEWPDGTLSGRFRFRHHLFREVLYDRVPVARRVRLHRTIGARVEQAFGALAPERAGELALHFQAGRDDGRAIRYLTIAAQQALERSAHREAIGHLSEALHILARRPALPGAARLELPLQRMLGPALLVTRGWGDPEAERAYARARALSEQLEDPAELARVLYGLAYLHEIRGDYARSEALLEERLRIEVPEPAPGFFIESHELLSCSRFHQGAFRQALENARSALRLFDDTVHDPFLASLGDNAAVGCHYWAGVALWFLGQPDAAVPPLESALALAERSQLIYMRAAAEWHMARLRLLRREFALAAEHADRAHAIAERQGYPYPQALALALVGRIRAAQGAAAAGLDLLRRGLTMQAGMAADMERPYCLGLLAEALLDTGSAGEALDVAGEALDILERRSRAFFWQAELHRLRGEALLQRGDVTAAGDSFDAARSIASAQGSPSLELRAAMSHYRLALRHGGVESARTALARVYAGFTEGFETADLRDARALLSAT